MPLTKELEVARSLARRAGQLALSYRTPALTAESKLDLSPVTIADRECERLIASELESAFPEDGLLGEEGAGKKSASGRRWIIDPVDGTRDFIRGIPTWGVLIALESGSDVVVGVCYLVEQDEMYYAAKGRGAFCNDQPIRVSKIADPAQSVLCVNGLNEILKQPFAGRLIEWMERFWAIRSMGGCQDAMLLASGRCEAWLEPSGKAWDFAPLKIITEEAGGVFFNFDGRASIYGENCAICVPALEVELRRFVIGASKPGSGTVGPPEPGGGTLTPRPL